MYNCLAVHERDTGVVFLELRVQAKGALTKGIWLALKFIIIPKIPALKYQIKEWQE